MINLDDELAQCYLAESAEHLAAMERDLLALEIGGEEIDDELVNRVFRAVHSVKGGAGFFDLAKIRELAHRLYHELHRRGAGRSHGHGDTARMLPNPSVPICSARPSTQCARSSKPSRPRSPSARPRGQQSHTRISRYCRGGYTSPAGRRVESEGWCRYVHAGCESGSMHSRRSATQPRWWISI